MPNLQTKFSKKSQYLSKFQNRPLWNACCQGPFERKNTALTVDQYQTFLRHHGLKILFYSFHIILKSKLFNIPASRKLGSITFILIYKSTDYRIHFLISDRAGFEQIKLIQQTTRQKMILIRVWLIQSLKYVWCEHFLYFTITISFIQLCYVISLKEKKYF